MPEWQAVWQLSVSNIVCSRAEQSASLRDLHGARLAFMQCTLALAAWASLGHSRQSCMPELSRPILFQVWPATELGKSSSSASAQAPGPHYMSVRWAGSDAAADARGGQEHHPGHRQHQCGGGCSLHPGGPEADHHLLPRHAELHDVRPVRLPHVLKHSTSGPAAFPGMQYYMMCAACSMQDCDMRGCCVPQPVDPHDARLLHAQLGCTTAAPSPVVLDHMQTSAASSASCCMHSGPQEQGGA